MIWQRCGWFVGILAAGLVFGAAASGQKTTAEALFREALMMERAEGKLADAVFRYERLIAEFPKERQFAAQALYQLALAYERLRDPRSRLMLTRLSRDYAGMEPYATRAREKLTRQASTQSGPFPEIVLSADYESGSPDGKLVIYHKSLENSVLVDTGRLYVMDLVTGKERLLLDHVGKSVSNFAWSPDSSQLAYNLLDPPVNEIRIVRISTGESASIGVRGYPYAWTNTDDILFYVPKFQASGIDYLLVPAKGGTPRLANADSGSDSFPPIITPDGTRLIVTKAKKLYLADFAGGEPRPLTTGSGSETMPVVSPDGQLVAFAANPEGNWALYVMPLNTELPAKEPLKISDISEPRTAAGGLSRQWWTRSGLLTLGLQQLENNIYRVPMDAKSGRAAGTPRRLTQDAVRNWLPAVSPDSKHIAYWYDNGSKIGIALMNSDGTNERPLLEERVVLDLSWRGNEEILLYSFKKPGEQPSIDSLNINTGIRNQVARIEGTYWTYVPNRNEILHLYPGSGGPRQNAVLKAFSIPRQRDREVAKIPYMVPVLCVSSDGEKLAYTTLRPIEGTNQLTREVGLMSMDGLPEGTLIPAQTSITIASSWSPDGKHLLLLGENGPMVMNVQTRASWPLHPETSEPSWSRRGTSWASDGTFVLVVKQLMKQQRMAWEGVTAEAVAKLMAARR